MNDRQDEKQILISLEALDKRIRADLDYQETKHHAQESMMEKVEGIIYLACLVMGAIFVIVHAYTDWIPYIVGLPSARVIITRFL